MSLNKHGFVAWEEHIVCPERGSRVVHYYLKDALGDSVLAVVGTERSIRHMIYVVSHEFLKAYGSNGYINASRKWTARRDVVDWLGSMVSTHRSPLCVSNSQINSLARDFGSFEASLTGFHSCNTYLPDLMVRRKLKVRCSDTEWCGVGWICSKQLMHYPSFHRNGTAISVHSFVFIVSEEENSYVGYLEDMYEDRKGLKKVKVRWFQHNWELKGVIPQLNPHPREVFITPHVQVISIDCVNGLATILTPDHYESCLAVFTHASLSDVYVCFRQFKNNKIKPFDLSRLHGYSNQVILSSMDDSILYKQKVQNHGMSHEYGEEMTYGGPVRLSGKRKRRLKGQQEHESGSGLIPGNQIAECVSTYPKLKLRIPRNNVSFEFVAPQSQCPFPFKVDENMELLCQDSGIRGCWFRCKILQVSRKHLKVRYDDVQDVEGCGNLEEWIPAFRVACPDKLGMRSVGRQTIRPSPPKDSTSCNFDIGAPVDAWWSDGWWEGVVSGVDISRNDFLQVYLPGEGKFQTVQQKNVRMSRDWVDNKWVEVMAKPDIASYLSANISSSMKLEASLCGSMASAEDQIVATSKLKAIEEDEPLPDSILIYALENGKEFDIRREPHANGDDKTIVHGGGGANDDGDNVNGDHEDNDCNEVELPL